MKNPRWANTKPKKTQGQISIHFHTIFGKNRLFPKKIPFYPPKILTTFFSHQLSFSNFRPPFSNFHPFPAKISAEKPLKIHVFSREMCKNPRSSEKTQEPKIRLKNPRSWEKTQGVATLVVYRNRNRNLETSKALLKS